MLSLVPTMRWRSTFEIQPLLDDRIVLIAAVDNPLASQRRVRVAELDGQNFVGFEGGSAIRQIVDTKLREAGIEINVVMELRSIPAILRMVATTGSLAFVSQLGVQGQRLVQEIDVTGLTINRRLGLATRKSVELLPSAARFAEDILRIQ